MTDITDAHEIMELKPCPFCGGEPELRGHRAPEFWVACPQMGCKASTEAFGSKDRAIAAWNTRTPDASQSELVSALEAAYGTLRDYIFASGEVDDDDTALLDQMSNALTRAQVSK